MLSCAQLLELVRAQRAYLNEMRELQPPSDSSQSHVPRCMKACRDLNALRNILGAYHRPDSGHGGACSGLDGVDQAPGGMDDRQRAVPGVHFQVFNVVNCQTARWKCCGQKGAFVSTSVAAHRARSGKASAANRNRPSSGALRGILLNTRSITQKGSEPFFQL